MRIHLELQPRTASSSAVTLEDSVPAPLLRLTPGGELILIELQGSLDIEGLDGREGQVLARLEFEKGREEKPTMYVSHHKLEGKFVNLAKPLAVLERRQREDKDAKGSKGAPARKRSRIEEGDGSPKSSRKAQPPSSPAPAFALSSEVGGAKGKNGLLDATSDDEDEAAGGNGEPASPTRARQSASTTAKGLDLGDDALLKPKAHPSLTPLRNASAHLAPPGSSPIPPPPAQGSELDFSSPIAPRKRPGPHLLGSDGAEAAGTQDEDEDEDDEDRPTSTSFDVVCIVRRKLLFAKRPEPVVRLPEEQIRSLREVRD